MEINPLTKINVIREFVKEGNMNKEQGYDLIDSTLQRWEEIKPKELIEMKAEPVQKKKKPKKRKKYITTRIKEALEEPKKKSKKTWKRGTPIHWTESEDVILADNMDTPVRSLLKRLPRHSRKAIELRQWQFRTKRRKLKQAKKNPGRKGKGYDPRHDNAKNNPAYAEKLQEDNQAVERMMEASKPVPKKQKTKCSAHDCNGIPEEGEIFCPDCLSQMNK